MAYQSMWTQWFPPAPTFTEKDIPSQAGKVFIVTGGNSGIGLELIKILYSAGATIYMATRSETKAHTAIAAVKASDPSTSTTPGQLKYLHLDLDDLATIKASASAFAAQESRLDILWNNAGIASVPAGNKTAQNLEQHMGVNCVAPYLFTQLLLPQLREAAKTSLPASVRVVWTSSWMAESQAPKGGVDFEELAKGGSGDKNRNYGASKAGNWLLAVEGARRYGATGIINVVQNPGNLQSNVWRHIPKLMLMMLTPLLHKSKLGAYTELYAGLSPDVTVEENGSYILPWGRLQKANPRKDIITAMKREEEGESAIAQKFRDWCDEQTKQYA